MTAVAAARLTWVLASTVLAAGYAVIAQTPAPPGSLPRDRRHRHPLRPARPIKPAAAGAVAARI